MLPVYKAISVDQEAIISGSTKPCIMRVAYVEEAVETAKVFEVGWK
jgi:hypothetical protein